MANQTVGVRGLLRSPGGAHEKYEDRNVQPVSTSTASGIYFPRRHWNLPLPIRKQHRINNPDDDAETYGQSRPCECPNGLHHDGGMRLRQALLQLAASDERFVFPRLV